MIKDNKFQKDWRNIRFGITGVSGSLGLSLSKALRSKGAYVVGFTHKSINSKKYNSKDSPNQWIQWECGKEEELDQILKTLDVLILNHGINSKESSKNEEINKSLEVNALSTLRLIQRFERIVLAEKTIVRPREIWVNTSEAEIQPAFSPLYEISKRLIGQLVSYKFSSLTNKEKERLTIKKIILGPFRSKLNPIGIMNSDFVANQIICQSNLPFNLIIITPNPLTYLIIPINEILRYLYFKLLKINI